MDVSWQDNPCVLHCGSGMVDTNLRNVPVGGWNRVIHTSSVDATMSKGWQSDIVPTKIFLQLFFLVMVFLVLSQKILEKWRLSLGRWWTQCSVKSWFLLSTSAFGVWVWQNPCINCVKMAYIKHTHSQIYTHSNTFICTCTYAHTHTCSQPSHTNAHVTILTHILIHVHNPHTQTHIHIYSYTLTHIQTHTNTHKHIHKYTHTHTYTLIHTDILAGHLVFSSNYT